MVMATNFANSASGTSWTTPTNANADDGAYATYTIAAKNTTGNENTLSNFGFDAVIPSGSTINSVTLEVQHNVSETKGIAFLESALAIGTTVGTFNSDGTEPTTDTIATYSGMARPGGGSWTRADLLDGTFTVRLRARSGNNATSVIYSWDYAKVTVDYTPQNFTVVAASGSYSITGQAASILHGAVLAASAGSYTYTGQAATITYTPATTGYTVAADAGSYSITGQAASIVHGYTLDCASGSYTYTGQSAALSIGRSIVASAGSYTVSGQPVTITYTGATPVAPAVQQGAARGRGSRKKYLEIDGKLVRFETEQEIIAYLDRLRAVKVRQAKREASQEVATSPPKIDFKPTIAAKEISLVDIAPIMRRIEQANRDILAAYYRRLEIEQEMDEEEAILLLL